MKALDAKQSRRSCGSLFCWRPTLIGEEPFFFLPMLKTRAGVMFYLVLESENSGYSSSLPVCQNFLSELWKV